MISSSPFGPEYRTLDFREVPSERIEKLLEVAQQAGARIVDAEYTEIREPQEVLPEQTVVSRPAYTRFVDGMGINATVAGKAWKAGLEAQRRQLAAQGKQDIDEAIQLGKVVDLETELDYLRAVETAETTLVSQFGQTAWNVWSCAINQTLGAGEELVLPWDDEIHGSFDISTSDQTRHEAAARLARLYQDRVE